MKIRILSALAIVAIAGGCSTASSPTHDLDAVKLPDGTQAWRVQCHGLFESSKTCFKVAQKVCGDKPMRLLYAFDRVTSGLTPKEDAREITFACGVPPAPVAANPTPAPASAPVPAPAPVAVHEMVLQADAGFDTDSAELKLAAQRSLDQFVEGNRGDRLGNVTISGYTDSKGSIERNLQLSKDRAVAVQNYLMQHGVHAASYTVRGYGSAMPVAPNNTAEGRARNRRVEIAVKGQ
jgi:OmpA-OmpF porin, OOP family